MLVLKYTKWQNFEKTINKAMISCKNSGISIKDCFTGVSKSIISGKGKEVIALAQTYFAVQTRKQEITEQEYGILTEEEKRFYQRSLTRKGNYSLNRVAINAGVKDLSKFHNSGYKGLYNGETADDIAKRKGLRYREDILDNMGSDELVANMFRISQTEQKLKRERIQGEENANDAHYEVGTIVRNAIKQAGGTMPEDLPTPGKSLKQLEKEKRNILNKKKYSCFFTY